MEVFEDVKTSSLMMALGVVGVFGSCCAVGDNIRDDEDWVVVD